MERLAESQASFRFQRFSTPLSTTTPLAKDGELNLEHLLLSIPRPELTTSTVGHTPERFMNSFRFYRHMYRVSGWQRLSVGSFMF